MATGRESSSWLITFSSTNRKRNQQTGRGTRPLFESVSAALINTQTESNLGRNCLFGLHVQITVDHSVKPWQKLKQGRN